MKEKQTWYYFQLIIILSIIAINLGISVAVKAANVYYIPNIHPFGFNINGFSSFLIVSFVIWGILKFDYLYKYNLASILILSGSLSNFIERLGFGSVRDYINIYIAQINLADIQIWIGLIILNYQIWFIDKEIKEKSEIISSFKTTN